MQILNSVITVQTNWSGRVHIHIIHNTRWGLDLAWGTESHRYLLLQTKWKTTSLPFFVCSYSLPMRPHFSFPKRKRFHSLSLTGEFPPMFKAHFTYYVFSRFLFCASSELTGLPLCFKNSTGASNAVFVLNIETFFSSTNFPAI